MAFYSTYGWHPLSVDAAIATLRWLRRNAGRLLRHVAEISAYFAERLGGMGLQSRIRGMAIAVETENASGIEERCRDNGLLLGTAGSALVLLAAGRTWSTGSAAKSRGPLAGPAPRPS